MNRTETDAVPALVLRRVFKAPRERVFAAWTTPEILSTFLGSSDVKVIEAQVDAREGGRFRVKMQRPDGEVFTAFGVYREVREPAKLAMTWTWEEDEPSDQHETLLTLEFNDSRGDTELVLTHEYLRSLESRASHEKGWNGTLETLERVL